MGAITLLEDVEVEIIDSMGSDEAIARAAMVSTKNDQRDITPEKLKGLIGFLAKNRHGTPFEHGSMTFRVKAPIFVFREWHRHRIGQSYNEMSGRYTKLRPEFYAPGADRALVQVGKPGHYEYVPGDSVQVASVRSTLEDAYTLAWEAYEEMLNNGIAKEVARMCLPVGIFSEMYVTLNPRSLMAFLSLRTKHEGAKFPSYPQREIEMCAEKLEAHFAYLFPVTYAAYNEAGRVCP